MNEVVNKFNFFVCGDLNAAMIRGRIKKFKIHVSFDPLSTFKFSVLRGEFREQCRYEK